MFKRVLALSMLIALAATLVASYNTSARSQLAPPGTIYDWINGVPAKTENNRYDWVGGKPHIYLEIETAPAYVPKMWFW